MGKDQVGSDEARRDWRGLLDAVQHRGEHVTVIRYGQTAAVMVPAGWYEHAQQALGEEQENVARISDR